MEPREAAHRRVIPAAKPLEIRERSASGANIGSSGTAPGLSASRRLENLRRPNLSLAVRRFRLPLLRRGMNHPGRDRPTLAPAQRRDKADVDQLDHRQHTAHGDRDQRAEREALARQRPLDRPGEGRIADPQAGRGDERYQRRDVADRLRRADGEHLVERDRADRAGDAVDADRDDAPVAQVEGEQGDHPAQRLALQVGVADEEEGGEGDTGSGGDRLRVDDAGDRDPPRHTRPLREQHPPQHVEDAARHVAGQPLLARYVPGSVLYVLGRVLLSERAGVPRRITIASIVYEQAISATSGVAFAAFFLISHPDLQSQPLRWAVLLVIPALVVLLSPPVFRPLADRVLRAFGREALPGVIPLRGVIALIAFYLCNWGVVSVGVYCVARSVSTIPLDEVLTVGSAQAVGYVAALVTLVAPAGLGIRDAAFAWAVKGALPGKSFALGSLIAIAVRGVMTVVELIYVGLVTALGRREGWSIPTGIVHASPEEQAEDDQGRDAAVHAPEIL